MFTVSSNERMSFQLLVDTHLHFLAGSSKASSENSFAKKFRLEPQKFVTFVD